MQGQASTGSVENNKHNVDVIFVGDFLAGCTGLCKTKQSFSLGSFQKTIWICDLFDAWKFVQNSPLNGGAKW